jgi:hypothetical protein
MDGPNLLDVVSMLRTGGLTPEARHLINRVLTDRPSVLVDRYNQLANKALRVDADGVKYRDLKALSVSEVREEGDLRATLELLGQIHRKKHGTTPEELAAKVDQLERAAAAIGERPRGAYWLGSGRIRIDGETHRITASNAELFLDTLLDLGGSANTADMRNAGIANPTEAANYLLRFRGGALSPYLTNPMGVRNAGWSTTIRDGRAESSQE